MSKDLYVLRRAAEVYQGLIERFAPQQRTDYVALLNEWVRSVHWSPYDRVRVVNADP